MALVASMKALRLSKLDVSLCRCVNPARFFDKPEKISRVSISRVGRMLPIIIDDPRTMLASTEHRMRPLRELVRIDDRVGHEKELVRAGDDANVNFRNILKSMHVVVLTNLIEKRASSHV